MADFFPNHSFPVFKTIALSIVLSLVTATFAYSQQVKSEGRYRCEMIFVGQYSDYKTKGTVTFDNPPVAIYGKIHVLKGPPCGRGQMAIRYEFPRRDSRKEPKEWTFNESLMPEKGSWWIIFATEPICYGTNTVDGSEGRIKYSRKNLDEVLNGIESASSGYVATPSYREKLYTEIEKGNRK